MAAEIFSLIGMTISFLSVWIIMHDRGTADPGRPARHITQLITQKQRKGLNPLRHKHFIVSLAGSSPASRTNRKASICKAFRFFLCTSDGCFHLFFPLQAGNAFDKPFHAVCAGLLHPICHMTIYIQCKCCGVVA